MADEDFLDVNSNENKILFFFMVLIVVIVLIFGYFFVYKKYHFEPRNLKVELGSTLSTDINDYLKKKGTSISGYKLNTSMVDTNMVGKYKYTVSYNGKTKKATIEVRDTTAPKFDVKDLVVEVGDKDFYLGDVLSYCDDLSKPCVVSFKNEKDEKKINSVGDYNLDIRVADVYNNYKKAKAHIKVVEKGSLNIEPDLEYASASVDLDDFKDEYYLKLDKPINRESIESTGYVDEISSIDWQSYAKNTYPNYTFKEVTIVSIYNKDGYVIGYAVDLCLSGLTNDTSIFVTKKVEE